MRPVPNVKGLFVFSDSSISAYFTNSIKKKIFSLSPNFLEHICQPYFPFACFAGCFVTSGNKMGKEKSSTVLSTDIKIEMDVAVEEDEQQLCTCTAVKMEVEGNLLTIKFSNKICLKRSLRE
jgi:hypothetical protein